MLENLLENLKAKHENLREESTLIHEFEVDDKNRVIWMNVDNQDIYKKYDDKNRCVQKIIKYNASTTTVDYEYDDKFKTFMEKINGNESKFIKYNEKDLPIYERKVIKDDGDIQVHETWVGYSGENILYNISATDYVIHTANEFQYIGNTVVQIERTLMNVSDKKLKINEIAGNILAKIRQLPCKTKVIVTVNNDNGKPIARFNNGNISEYEYGEGFIEKNYVCVLKADSNCNNSYVYDKKYVDEMHVDKDGNVVYEKEQKPYDNEPREKFYSNSTENGICKSECRYSNGTIVTTVRDFNKHTQRKIKYNPNITNKKLPIIIVWDHEFEINKGRYVITKYFDK